MRRRRLLSSLLAFAFLLPVCTGCGGDDVLSEFKERNRHNVAKVATCFKIFASRNRNKSPESQEELIEFMLQEKVAKNLERMGLDVESINEIFVSDRDGKPLKVRWGAKWNPEVTMPIAFEAEGKDGIRLVAADVVLEVTSDEEYDELWEGNYEPEWLKLKRGKVE